MGGHNLNIFCSKKSDVDLLNIFCALNLQFTEVLPLIFIYSSELHYLPMTVMY